MRLLHGIMRRIEAAVKRHASTEDGPPKCAVCQHGPNPALGVPIQCTDGLHRHWMCMVVGYRMGAIAKGAELQAPSRPTGVVVRLGRAVSPRVTVN